MNNDAAGAMAQRVAAAWGALDGVPRLIRNRENIVFEALFTDGRRAALRLHRAGYQTTQAIEAELIWTERLAEAGFPCALPLRCLNGDLVCVTDGVAASVVTWIDADGIGENDVTYDGNEAAHCALYRDVGRLIRALHEATDAMDTGDITRPSWEREALLGDAPLWGRFWENPSLTSTEVDELQAARARAKEHLTRLDPAVGLIHADLLQENILQNGAGLWLIDFDDSGLGYRGYDLGTALIQHAELAYLPALEAALCDGYGADAALRDAVPLYVMLRSMT